MIEPDISFCFFGRNDNYTPDFLYRLSTTINFIAASAEQINALTRVEIVVVDWASDMPLSQVVSLSPAGAQIAKFVYVDQQTAETYSDSALPGNVCANIGLRRAKGRLITVSGAEILLPSTSLSSLFAVIEKQTFIENPDDHLYVCGRYRIPAQWVLSQPDVKGWQQYLLKNSWRIEKEPGRGGFLTGNAGLFIIPKKLLQSATGLLEELDPHWGWNDVEYTVRATAKVPCVDLNALGVTVFDMEHFKTSGTRTKIVKQPAPRLLADSFKANPDNWGAAQVCFSEQFATPEKNNCLDRAQLQPTANIGALFDFYIWMSDYLVHLPDEQESEFLVRYAQFLCQANLLYYKEYGINCGHSFYLTAFFNKFSHLIGVDTWQEGGGEKGVDHIAWNLTTPAINHLGYLRLVNQRLVDDYTDITAYEADEINGVVCFRVDEYDVEILVKLIQLEIKKHRIMLVGKTLTTLIEHPKLSKYSWHDVLTDYAVFSEPFTTDTNMLEDLATVNALLHCGQDLTGLTSHDVVSTLEKLNDERIILWSTTSLGQLIMAYLDKLAIPYICCESVEQLMSVLPANKGLKLFKV